MNTDVTQVESEGSTQTNTSSRLGLRNPRGCVCVRAHGWSVCWKPDQRGHYWRQLEWSVAAHKLELCPSPSITLLSSLLYSLWISALTCPARSASISHNPTLTFCTNGSFSTPLTVLLVGYHCFSGSAMWSPENVFLTPWKYKTQTHVNKMKRFRRK